MSDKEFPRPGAPNYKIVSIAYSGVKGWKSDLENTLNANARIGYRPILCGDSGGQFTVIMEKISDE